MTKKEMQGLSKGEIVVDLESTTKWGRTVLCEVAIIEDTGVVIDALKECDKGGYPHRFEWDYESHKLGKVTVEGVQ